MNTTQERQQEGQKKRAALAALDFVEYGEVLGVGSGSTVNYFIDALKPMRGKIEAVVGASLETERRLKALSIPVIDLNAVDKLTVYIDGADEVTSQHELIKGGGGALTREKIIAHAAEKFICLINEKKCVDRLGGFPVPVEVIPMARSFVAREIVKLGGQPVWRENFVTDNGNVILDVHHLKILSPSKMEEMLNQIPGIVANGIFAHRSADIVLMGTGDTVKQF